MTFWIQVGLELFILVIGYSINQSCKQIRNIFELIVGLFYNVLLKLV